ncbi:MAG: pro-sigmaK processing inhibitor BofA family protein [Oscillospiraceae bacterium]
MQNEYFGITAAEIIFYGIMLLAAAAMLIHYIRSEKPLKTTLKGMISGASGLVLLHFFGGDIGLALPLNTFTVFISLTLGLPGTAAMCVLQIIA